MRVELTVDKDTSVEILLCVVAEDFVFFHDARIHFTDELEIGLRGVPVSVDLICHLGALRARGEKLLNHDEMRPGLRQRMFR